MSGKVKNISGLRFGRLTVLNEFKVINRYAYWLCRCDCGIEKYIKGHNLGRNTNSCGCIRNEGKYYYARTHGLSNHPLYVVHTNIISRCYDEKNTSFLNYGGRGIGVCNEWRHDFIAFYNWCIDNNWKKGLEIDRKDNDGPYSKENCRIVEKIINTNNKRNSFKVEYNGEILSALDIWDIYLIDPRTVKYRLKKGWPVEKALTKVGYRGIESQLSVVNRRRESLQTTIISNG